MTSKDIPGFEGKYGQANAGQERDKSITRKDYELMTEIIRPKAQFLGVQDLARHLAARLAKDNPNFDLHRFLTDCGVPN